MSTNTTTLKDEAPAGLEQRLEEEQKRFGSSAEEERAKEDAVAQRREQLLAAKSETAKAEVEHAKEVAAAHKAKMEMEEELSRKVAKEE